MQVELNAMELLFIKSSLTNMSDTFYKAPIMRSQFRELQQKVNSAINTYPDETPSPIRYVNNNNETAKEIFLPARHPFFSEPEAENILTNQPNG